MKFTCLQENLARGLQTVSKAIPVKGSLPILANVLITAKDGNLNLSATNMELAISTNVPASVEEEGSITVPARLLREFVSTLSPSTIKAELKDETLHLVSDKTKTKFNGMNAQDYPEFPKKAKDAISMDLDPKTLLDAIALVSFAAGGDASRPVFTGISLDLTDGELTIASTDGYRLSEKTLPIQTETKNFKTIIPAKTLAETVRIFASAQEPVKFYLSENENLAIFETEDSTVATIVLDGQYPDYKRIIPTETNLKAVFPSDEFAEAVKLTKVFTKEGDSTVRIRFDSAGKIKIVTLAEETGEHESVFDAEIDGETTEVAFNSKYLLDFLNNVKSEKICFETNGNVSPCILRPQDYENYIHVIMPLQV